MKKILDFRFVYILKVTKKNLYKIGISTDPKRRIRGINRSLKKQNKPDKVRLHYMKKVFFAMNVESFLHSFFGRSQKEFYGSGKTEYFIFNAVTVNKAVFLLWIIHKLQKLLKYSILIILTVILTILSINYFG